MENLKPHSQETTQHIGKPQRKYILKTPALFLLSFSPALTSPLPTLGYHITFIASLYFSSLCVAGLGS
jgi:hypothetical protein